MPVLPRLPSVSPAVPTIPLWCSGLSQVRSAPNDTNLKYKLLVNALGTGGHPE